MTDHTANNSDNILEASHLQKSFLSGARTIKVLRDINLIVERGCSISISGESGSGKSTLLNIIAGLEIPDAGSLFWKGKQINTDRPAELADSRGKFIGMVFQAYYLIPELNALENVLMAYRVNHSQFGRKERNRASCLLERVGLSSRQTGLVTELSGGERQRVALARALMNRPPLILADEPTGNLDEKTAHGVMDLLLDVCREEGASLILVTHNPVFAARTDRALQLHEGILTNQE